MTLTFSLSVCLVKFQAERLQPKRRSCIERWINPDFYSPVRICKWSEGLTALPLLVLIQEYSSTLVSNTISGYDRGSTTANWQFTIRGVPFCQMKYRQVNDQLIDKTTCP